MIDPDDERTALSRRAAEVSPDDERTVLSRRTSPGIDPSPDDEPDDRTLPGRRARGGTTDAAVRGASEAPRRSTALPPDVDVTALSARSAAPPDSELATQAATVSGPIGPRRSAPAGTDDSGDRAADPSARVDGSSPRGRVASAPRADAAVYRARPVPSVTAARAEPAPRAPQAYVDTAAAEAGRRRRRRRRAIVAVVAASVLVVVIAVSLVALLTVG